MSDNGLRLAILIPTYNERENIVLLIKTLREMADQNRRVDFSVFVIDDSSPDGTASVVNYLGEELLSNNYRVAVISRAKKEGLGKAYIHGFNIMKSLECQPDYVLQMDADLSHDPGYITAFLRAVEFGADLIVGTRYVEGGGYPDWPWYRIALSSFGNFYARLMLGSMITDYTGGYNMYSIGLLRLIDLNSIDCRGYGFLIELKYRASKISKKIVNVPIKFMDRKFGFSKMPVNTIFKNFLLVLRIRFQLC